MLSDQHLSSSALSAILWTSKNTNTLNLVAEDVLGYF
jgi:hypothetical protein